MKKVFTISAIVLILCAIALGIYYMLLRTNEQVSSGKPVSIRDFFPFGNTETPNTETQPQATSTEPNNPSTNEQPVPRLRRITDVPVAGATFVETRDGAIIRYIEQTTGHIYDVSTYSSYNERVSNNTITNIYKALFVNNGSSVILQTSQDGRVVQTTYRQVLSSATGTVQTLGTTVIDVVPSTDDSSFITKEKSGNTFTINSINGNSLIKKILYSLPINVHIDSLNKNSILAYTKPYNDTPGYAYTINTQNGTLTRVVGDINGLMVSGSSNGSDFVGYGTDRGLFSYNTKTATTSRLTPPTIPTKCVWNKLYTTYVYCGVPTGGLDTNSADSWFMGDTSFTDSIYEYNIKTGTSFELSNLKDEFNQNIDIVNPLITDDGMYMLFINKKDGSLWLFDLFVD